MIRGNTLFNCSPSSLIAMKRLAPLTSSPLFCTTNCDTLLVSRAPLRRCLHTTSLRPATPLPLTATGPPPAAPRPSASQYGERVERRRRQAELLKKGQDLRSSQMKPGSAMKKRFWKNVIVQRDEGTLSSSLRTGCPNNP